MRVWVGCLFDIILFYTFFYFRMLVAQHDFDFVEVFQILIGSLAYWIKPNYFSFKEAIFVLWDIIYILDLKNKHHLFDLSVNCFVISEHRTS